MKNKTNRLHFSTRTLAMVMSIVMLIGSIATGSMLNTFAAYLKDNVNSDAVSQAASEGSDIAKSAIPSQDADAANTTDNNDVKDAPDLSDFEENEIVRGMKDDLADTGANTDLAQTGYSSATFYLKKENGDAVTNSTITLDGSNRGTYTYSGVSTYQGQWMRFYIEADNDQFGINGTATDNKYVTNGSNFNLSKGPKGQDGYYGYYKVGDNATSVTFTFQLNSNDGTIQVSETSSSIGWYLIGGNNNEWGAWNTSAKSNELLSNGTEHEYSITVTVTRKTYFRVHDGGTEYNLSSSSDKAITSDYQNLVANNKKAIYLNSAGTYTITVYHDGSTKKIKAEQIAMSTLTVADTANATVTATYNGLIASEGAANKLSDIPKDAKITVNVAADQGYEISSAVYYPDNAPSDKTNLTFTANRATFTMPASNTTIKVTMIQMDGMRKVYFNNYKSKYSKVFAYAYDKSGDVITRTPLGPRPGTAMTKLDNSNTWVIEVPAGTQNIIFTGDDGANTADTNENIDWTLTNPMYYPASTNKTNPAGDWKEYVPRTNEYEVTAGDTMDDYDYLYSGINATFYDYLYDSEIINDRWLSSITSTDYSGGVHDPYTILNKGLSDYAKYYTTDGVANDVTYPLYFGILAVNPDNNMVKDYYHFYKGVNNASGLTNSNNALLGLTGQTLDSDGIHYYKSGKTDENGAPMALFDEDFLSGENTAGSDNSSKVLATILRSHAFPVRKKTEVNVSGITQLYITDPNSKWTQDNAKLDAYFFGGTLTEAIWKQVSDTATNGKYSVEVPPGAGKVIFTRAKQHITSFDNKWNQTGDITLHLTGSDAINLYTATGKMTCSESLDVSLDGCTSGSHTYYEYNSTDGKDNAFITDINTSNHTAQINYYPDSTQYAQYSSKKGFFPFDYNNIIVNNGNGGTNGYKASHTATDQGFGVKLEIPFTVNNGGLNVDGTAQTFDFSGDDDLWVFIDDHLVLDLGGAHARTTGSIDFNSMTATSDHYQMVDTVVNGTNPSVISRNGSFGTGWFDNTKTTVPHKMTIYYMERGMQNSNLKFGFSFNAIPNQLKVEKKIRTNTVNSGFYKVIANQTAAVDGSNNPILNDKGKQITWFENSYQADDFIITQQYQNIANDPVTGNLLDHVSYTLNDTPYVATPTVDKQFDYHSVKNNDVCYTLGQFPANQYMKLWENLDPEHVNIYKYTPSVSLYDDAVNPNTKLVKDADGGDAVTGNNDEGFQFLFKETKPISNFANLNMRAQVENDMVNHTLTLRKVTDVADTTSTFPITITWKFATQPEDAYFAYPLYCTVDGVDQQFDNSGTITIKSGQTVVIPGIPENAEMKIVEGTPNSSNTYRYGGTAVTDGSGTPITANVANITKGITYKMGATDTVVTVNNKQKTPYVDMTFTYPSYLKRNNSEFLDDRYHISNRRLMDYEVANYFNINDDGSISFKPTADGVDYKANFINYIAPYEDNFMQTILWDAAGANFTYNPTTDTLVGTVGSTTQGRSLNLSVKLPYANSGDTGTATAFTVTNGATYSGSPVEVPIINTTTECFQWLSFNEYKSKDADPNGSKAAFLTAPLVLPDAGGGNSYYFDYWKISNTTSGTNNYSKEYTRCYYYKLNLTLFQDSIIEAVYHQAADGEVAPTIKKAEEIAQAAQHASTDGVQITFIENSRNQYNMANSSHTSEKRRISGDRIYTDFLLSFNNATGDNQVLNEYDRGTYTCGIVIEKAGVVDKYGVTQNETGYQTAYGADVSSSNGMNESQIKTYITSNGSDKPEGTVAILSKFDAKDLDNKNRIEYFYSLANKQDGSLKELGNKDLVYRAYAFIAEGTESNLRNVKISTVPVYYTIKQIAEYQY